MVASLDSFSTGFAKPAEHHKVDAKTMVSSLSSAMDLRNRATLRSTVKTVFSTAFPGCEVEDDAWLRLPSAARSPDHNCWWTPRIAVS